MSALASCKRRSLRPEKTAARGIGARRSLPLAPHSRPFDARALGDTLLNSGGPGFSPGIRYLKSAR